MQSRILLVQRHKEFVHQVLPPHEPLLPQELLPWEEMRWLPLLAQLAG